MPPFPNIWTIGLTFDPDLWPTDLSINRDHLLNKVWSLWGKAFLSYPSHKVWEIGTNFDLDLLTWISIGAIYSLRAIYLPRLKLVGQSVLELSVAQGEVDYHDLWPTDLNINRVIYSSRTIYLPRLKLVWQSVLELSFAQGEVDWHDFWPWPLTYWPEYQ